MLRRGLASETALRLLEATERLDSEFDFENRFYHDYLDACTKCYGLSDESFKQTLCTNSDINDSDYVFWLKLSYAHAKLVDAIFRWRYVFIECKNAPIECKNKAEYVRCDCCMQGIRFLREYYKHYGINPKLIKSVDGQSLSSSLVAYFC